MAIPLEEVMKDFTPAQRRRINARAAQLIAEELTLQKIRKAQKLTQKRMAKKLGIGQEGVSRLENRSDLLLSTLRNYVEAMGGHLKLVAEFPDQPPIILAGLVNMEPAEKP
jgi:DNA-binding XRE family transcriptional regulator